uniref:Autophagy-related protein 2 n=1 Tax=Vitis vinifera TaxID=29760 RepID=A5AFZ2_VITVI|nr:hypothetical protein VITISV_022258 [Vitis vinifera]
MVSINVETVSSNAVLLAASHGDKNSSFDASSSKSDSIGVKEIIVAKSATSDQESVPVPTLYFSESTEKPKGPLEGISEEDMKLVMESKTGAISHKAQSQDENAFVQASAAVATGEGIPTCESFVADFCSTTGQESVTDILLPHLISDWVPFSVNDQKEEEQHVETNLKATIAGISIVFAFHDENQRHSCDLGGAQANVGSNVHYLGAECRDMLFISQSQLYDVQQSSDEMASTMYNHVENLQKEVTENELMLGQEWNSTIVQIIKAVGKLDATAGRFFTSAVSSGPHDGSGICDIMLVLLKFSRLVQSLGHSPEDSTVE